MKAMFTKAITRVLFAACTTEHAHTAFECSRNIPSNVPRSTVNTANGRNVAGEPT